MITDAELDAIEARAKAATEGPWLFKNNPQLSQLSDKYADFKRFDDCVFIAHARTDIPRLVAELRAARESVHVVSQGVELIRADAQYLHAGFKRHGELPECTPKEIEKILDRALSIQRKLGADK